MDFSELPQTANTTKQSSHFLNKKFLVMIIVLLLVAGGAYAGMSYWQSNLNTPVVTFTPRPSDTANWKTYTNTQYGFEFKYPAYLIITEDKHDNLFVGLQDPKDTMSEGSTLYSISVEPTNESSIELWFDKEFNNRNNDKPFNKNISFNGINALQIDDPLTIGGCVGNYIAFIHKQYLYEIPDPTCEQNMMIIRINSTFKFIDNGQVCAQVITRARNTKTGEVKDFPTPCDVPDGWIKIDGMFCGGIAPGAFPCPSGYSCQLKGTYPDAGGHCEKDSGKVCLQVITRAKNPSTGQIKDFPTPCDVPDGWVTVDGM